MAIKKEGRRLHSSVKAKSAEAAKHAAHLAPPEEQNGMQTNGQRANKEGAIIVDTSKLKMPKAVIEEEDSRPGLFGIDPLIVLIFCLALAFIAFIAFMIYIEPSVK